MLSLGLASCFVSAPAANAASTVNTANKALADYMALDSKGKLKEKKALDEFRWVLHAGSVAASWTLLESLRLTK